LNTLATNNNQAKRQILGEISGAKKKTKSLFNQIKPILHQKIQINKNKLKFCERTLKRTKHIIDRKTGKFRGENARASKFQDSERGIICQRRINGETYAAIGKSYGKGVSTIKNICQNWGPKNGYPYETKIGKSNLKKVTSPKIKTAICKEYSEGISAMKLAIKYELSFQTVYTFLADWGPKNNIPYIKHKTD
jgi:transposase